MTTAEQRYRWFKELMEQADFIDEMLYLDVNEDKERRMKKDECKHLNARIANHNSFGLTSCPDCGEEIYVDVVVNNMLDAMGEKL